MIDPQRGAAQRVHLAFDGTALLGTRTGVGHVAASMLAELAARPEIEVIAYAVTRSGRHDFSQVIPEGVRASTRGLPARVAFPLWRRVGRPRVEFWTGAVDVVHATNYAAPPARVPVLITVHDLAYLSHELTSPHSPDYGSMVLDGVRRGAFIHVFSDHVAGEVRDRYRLEDQRVQRVYPGLAAVTDGDPAAGRRLANAGRYVLALGTVEPRKNLPRLVRAFDAVAAEHDDLVLVIAGPEGWGEEALVEAVGRTHHADRIRRLGYLPDRGRTDLLAGAAVLAYPSLYEGFGHPPLEAMSAGVPVVATSAGSLPEVLGDAAILVDPMETDELSRALATAVEDADIRAELVRRGLQQAARYTWARTADQLIDLYRRLAFTAR